MTYKEIQIVSWSCSIIGWLFLIFAKAPEIALAFLFAGLGGFIWGELKKKWGMK
jgi:hypothetical protein